MTKNKLDYGSIIVSLIKEKSKLKQENQAKDIIIKKLKNKLKVYERRTI